MRILIVVDEPLVADAMKTLLEQAMPRLLWHACTTAAASSALAEHGPFDAVVLDHFAPVEGRSRSARVLATLPPELPVVVIENGHPHRGLGRVERGPVVESVSGADGGGELVRAVSRAIGRATPRATGPAGSVGARRTGPTCATAAALLRGFVWRSMAEGASDLQIARRLRASEVQVRAWREDLLALLEARDRTHCLARIDAASRREPGDGPGTN